MKHLFTSIMLSLSFVLIATHSKAQGFSILIDSFEVQAGQEVCIPVKCKGFIKIVSYQFSLEWNPSVLKFNRTQNYGLPSMSATDFSPNGSSGFLLHGWADPAGLCVDKPDGTTLFEVCFTAIGSTNSNTSIIPGSSGFNGTGSGGAEAYNCLGQNVWSQAGNDTGFVKIIAFSSTSELAKNQQPTFQLYPNPTNGVAQISFGAGSFGIATVTLTDLLGRTVLNQKIEVKPGKNSYEIPANLLTSKGMYQVSLQTEHEVSTRMLSVQ